MKKALFTFRKDFENFISAPFFVMRCLNRIRVCSDKKVKVRNEFESKFASCRKSSCAC